jgi:hypothetical protein
MINSFKRILATISLIIMLCLSASVMFVPVVQFMVCGDNYCGPIYYFLILVGPITLVLYILFLKSKRDLFFYLTVAPLFIIILLYFLPSLGLGKSQHTNLGAPVPTNR